ncbi:MAG: nucleotide sugar dehydrogenase [Candidatus Brocadiia bacterium]
MPSEDTPQRLRQFIEKARRGEAVVAVAGLGYVGLPMAICCARGARRVIGIDVSHERVEMVLAGRSYIDDISDAELGELVEAGRLTATEDYSAVADSDVVLICVPTPLRKTGEPEVSFIVRAVDAIAEHMGPGKLIILESTTYPGTTEELARPRLERGELSAGEDFWLAFSPERIDPGPSHADWNIHNVPKVVGGVTANCTRAAAEFYGQVVQNVVPVSSSSVAEMVKLLENTYRSVNIAMVNELALMCHELGVDVWEVVDAARTKPYGFQAFYPGPGLGGHCIPVDPFYLAWKARLHGFEPRFIDLAGRINASMPRHVVERLAELLNREGKPLNGSRVHVLGVAYKRDVSDTRESPVLVIVEDLLKRGAVLTYTDPHVPDITLPDGTRLDSTPLEEANLPDCDCAVIITDHAAFPYERIVAEAPLILDTRNALCGRAQAHIHKL